jgi:hypothetical protein
VTAMQTLFFSIIFVIQAFIRVDIIMISIFPLIVYYVWAIGQFFEKKKAMSYIKVLLSYIVGLFIIALVSAVGAIIELLIK